MFLSYFKIAWRNLAKQKKLAFINIFGLSAGIACFSLFMLYAVNELNFDNFHKNGDNVYRVYQWDGLAGGNTGRGMADLPMPLGPAMKQDLPGVKNYVRFLDNWGGNSFIKTDKAVLSEAISFADPGFFSVFSFKLKYGDAITALQGLHNIVLTEGTAEKIFGRADVVGEIVQINQDDKFEPFTVTAITENLPSNSSIQFDILGNFNYHAATAGGKKGQNNWGRNAYATFVQLNPGSTLSANKKLFDGFRKKYYPDEDAEARKNGWAGNGPSSWYGLQPLSEMHTNPLIDSDSDTVNPKIIWILLSIAAGILLIACINFTTLAIGRSAGRAKEVGIRKVIGGTRAWLAAQFLAEALLLSIISAIVGLLLAKALLPFFNTLSGRALHFSMSQFPQLIWLLIGLVLIVGLLAGSYPALVLSRFKPVEVLKAKIKLGGANYFTKTLVTFQFVLSTGFIVATVIITQQLHYMQSKNPGFNRGNVVDVDARGISDTKRLYALLKQGLILNPGIAGTASAANGLGEGTGLERDAFKYNGKDKQVYNYSIDADYIRVLGMQLLEGRNFNPTISSDTISSVIINEAMMNDFDWTFKTAIGQRLTGYNGSGEQPIVIGVVKNFNFQGMQQKVQPQMFQQYALNQSNHFFVRLKPGDPSNALAAIQTEWKKIAPDYPLKYNFLDENLNHFYQSESRWSSIIGWAGGISIFLAILGLLGLSALTAINRTKEIGIRRVLGASLSTIVSLLSKDFLKLVLVSFLIAIPIAWYFMTKWLQDYAYRITIQWWVFALTGMSIVVIAVLTTSLQAIKTAIANPVKSLHTE
jgi:putative ABC transport system permease protein